MARGLWLGPADFRIGRNRLPRHSPADEDLVSSHVEHDQPEKRHQRLGLQRVLGLGSYRTAWLMLRKLRQPEGEKLLSRVHLAVSLLKRWMLGTHQGSTAHKHLEDYLKEFVSRFSRRKSASRGKLFYRLAQQSVQIEPMTYDMLTKPLNVGVG
jgi:hypothetical protein